MRTRFSYNIFMFIRCTRGVAWRSKYTSVGGEISMTLATPLVTEVEALNGHSGGRNGNEMKRAGNRDEDQ